MFTMENWVLNVAGLRAFITADEFPRLHNIISNIGKTPAPPAAGPRTREEIDALILSVYRLSRNKDQDHHLRLLDEIFGTLYVCSAFP